MYARARWRSQRRQSCGRSWYQSLWDWKLVCGWRIYISRNDYGQSFWGYHISSGARSWADSCAQATNATATDLNQIHTLFSDFKHMSNLRPIFWPTMFAKWIALYFLIQRFYSCHLMFAKYCSPCTCSNVEKYVTTILSPWPISESSCLYPRSHGHFISAV